MDKLDTKILPVNEEGYSQPKGPCLTCEHCGKRYYEATRIDPCKCGSRMFRLNRPINYIELTVTVGEEGCSIKSPQKRSRVGNVVRSIARRLKAFAPGAVRP